MKPLNESELAAAIQKLPQWSHKNGALSREWKFADFVAAMMFVNRVADLAEAAGHHPDIDIRYNRVTLALVTHDAGGITQRDVEMAGQLSNMKV